MASFLINSCLRALFIYCGVLLLSGVSEYVSSDMGSSLPIMVGDLSVSQNYVFLSLSAGLGATQVGVLSWGFLDGPFLEMASDAALEHNGAVWGPYRPHRNNLHIMPDVGYLYLLPLLPYPNFYQ